MSISVVLEGDTDIPVVRKLAQDAGLAIGLLLDAGGKDPIDRKLEGYNAAAQGSPWLVLRDLDRDAPCAPTFLLERSFQPSRWMCFRLAVREVEAWLLADHQGVADYFRVDRKRIPAEPDFEPDPKRALIHLARSSRSTAIKRAMLPRRGAAVGPQYEATIIEFGLAMWDLDRACARSPSLARGRAALHDLAKRWRAVGG